MSWSDLEIRPGALFTAAGLGLAVLFSLFVLSRRKRDPAVTLSWMLAFFLLPGLAEILYMLIGYRGFTLRRRLKKRLKRAKSKSLAEPESTSRSRALPSEYEEIEKLCESLTSFPVAMSNQLELYENATSTYSALAEAIQSAKHHVHLEYYIFQPDATGMYFRDLLVQKAKEGVQCRLLVDHIGSFSLAKSFTKPMEQAGVKFAFFWPMSWARPWAAHLRNHRKLVIVDGQIGFVGSQNIGNEYVRWRSRRLSWRDTVLRIHGPSVRHMQRIFLEDWKVATGERVTGAQYFVTDRSFAAQLASAPKADSSRSGSPLQVVPTGPDEARSSLEMILTQLIVTAKERIVIVTPYLVPTETLLIAMGAATRRGVRVELIVPKKSDHYLTAAAGRAWFPDMHAVGARVYEYSKTFVHAKLVIIDEKIVLLGSANMDERSFRLNFELSLLIYDPVFARRTLVSFEEMLAEARPARGTTERVSFWRDLRDGFFKVLSPLL